MSLEVAIFTAIFGGKDCVKDPLNYVENEHIDYFLITDDQELRSNCYNIIHKKPIYDDITKNARYYKILGLEAFKNYDYVIWHDANMQINHEEVPNLLKFVSKNGLAFFDHPERDCVYDEAIKCIKLEKDYPHQLLKQVLKYFLKGVKNNKGLFATGLFVRNNKFNNEDFLKSWWFETKTFSRRDQISLSYCLKKFQIIPIRINGDIRNNVYSIFHKHNHNRYEFLTTQKQIPFLVFQKKMTIRIILLLKKINFGGV
ncbi:DUF616 domain-containing protein [Mangrovimonas sp. CR14]|uniref:glycosyltransferase domain-containing protein n=1 Tax=Mangrovimonas sp. CR14 TaxID=2706120 RepID=UPI001421CBCC|nr:glycosyltransferase domain-containing protein [Mangrovimonas sp. CR14]NIK92529.1 DUF616 domain-containing protein [Mangrovimonas sp. CR14]